MFAGAPSGISAETARAAALLQQGAHHAVVALGHLFQLLQLDVLVVGVGQILPGGAQTHSGDASLAGVVAAVGIAIGNPPLLLPS